MEFYSFIHVSPWLKTIQRPPTLFTVTTEIFHMTHKPLGGVPPSASPSDSVSYHSAISSPVMLDPCGSTLANGPLPQGPCTGCSLCLEHFSSRQVHDLLLYFIQVSLGMSLHRTGLIGKQSVLRQHHPLPCVHLPPRKSSLILSLTTPFPS